MPVIFARALQGLLAAALAACSAPDGDVVQLREVNARDTAVHAASGMRFPERVDEFRRIALTRYDKEGLDVSAGYALTNPSGPIIAIINVSPTQSTTQAQSDRDRLCDEEFGRRKAEFVSQRPGATLVDQQAMSWPQGERRLPARRASYDYAESLRGTRVELSSSLFVFCFVGDRWAVQYRFTSPREVRAAEPIWSFVNNLPWTIADPS
jgi:hypothetical protein